MNQLFNLIPRHVFEKSVKMYKSDRYSQHFKSWHQFLLLLYAQGTGKVTLRDIESGLLLQRNKLYHLGLNSVKRSTFADSLKKRDYRLFEDLFYGLLDRVQALAPKHKFKFKNPLYSLDASFIDLCLSSFDWAKYRTTKGAIKLHVGLDHRGYLPNFCTITEGNKHELPIFKKSLIPEPDSIYCFDKGFLDFKWFYSLHKAGCYFVTRTKKNHCFYTSRQHKSIKNKHILRDDVVQYLVANNEESKYPEQLRLVEFKDPETNIIYQYFTNNFKLAASTIAEIYKQRWQIEIFFRWIKQNLKVKTFIGTSKNAVLSQVWVAMIYYLLVAYIKFTSKCKISLSDISKRLKSTFLTQISLLEVIFLDAKHIKNALPQTIPKQLTLF